jgi:hypothetical protein
MGFGGGTEETRSDARGDTSPDAGPKYYYGLAFLQAVTHSITTETEIRLCVSSVPMTTRAFFCRYSEISAAEVACAGSGAIFKP